MKRYVVTVFYRSCREIVVLANSARDAQAQARGEFEVSYPSLVFSTCVARLAEDTNE